MLHILDVPLMRAIDSCREREKFIKFGDIFTMIKSISYNTQCQCLNPCNGFSSRFTVGKNPW